MNKLNKLERFPLAILSNVVRCISYSDLIGTPLRKTLALPTKSRRGEGQAV